MGFVSCECFHEFVWYKGEKLLILILHFYLNFDNFRDNETEDQTAAKPGPEVQVGNTIVQTAKGLFDVPSSAPAIEYKKGYVMRKCCMEPNGKKSKFLIICL